MAPERTVLQLSQKDFGDWLELHGRKLYREVRDDLRADLRTQDARWQSLNARVAALGNHLETRVEACQAELGTELHHVTEALYALRNELQVQRAAYRDPFSVLAALLRDVRPSAVRVGHVIWLPKTVDTYLRETWRLTDGEIRAYKCVWRDAKLIAVERDTFARKFTIEPGVVAYMFAVPTRVLDLFRIEPGSVSLAQIESHADKPIPVSNSTST